MCHALIIRFGMFSKGDSMLIKKMILFFPVLLVLSFLFNVDWAEARSKGKLLQTAGKAAKKTYRKSATGEGAMTEEMIEDCILLKREIENSSEDMGTSSASLDTQNKELEAQAEEIKKSKESVDPSDENSVNEYNKKVKAYQQKVAAFESERKEHNAGVDQYQQKFKKFESECKGQSYYQDDYDKVVEKVGYGM